MVRHFASSTHAATSGRHRHCPRFDTLESRLVPGEALFGMLSMSSMLGTALVTQPPGTLGSVRLEIDGQDLYDIESTAIVARQAPCETTHTPDSTDTRDAVAGLPATRVTPAPLLRGRNRELQRPEVVASSTAVTAPNSVAIVTPALRAAPSLRIGALIAPVQPKTNVQPSQPTDYRPAVAFEANVGQTDSQVRFLSRSSGYTLFLTPSEAVMLVGNETDSHAATESSVVRMQYIGANPDTKTVGQNELAGKVNYYVGQDQSQWRSGVPTFGQVTYQNLYPGIDLTYYGNANRELEYDFIVSPGVHTDAIQLKFTGADDVRIEDNGDLILGAGNTQLRQQKPFAYQEIDGVRRQVPARFDLSSGDVTTIRFEIGAYDTGRPLVIDPVVGYSSFHGGNNTDSAEKVAVDSAGNAYVVGFTNSTNFPTPNGLQKTKVGLIDAFVSKVSAQGTLAWSTYLGGTQSDYARGVAVDAAGTVHVTGNTRSGFNFPILNAFQDRYGRGGWDAFVTKLNTAGTLTYSSYLGGTGDDIGRGLVLDAAGNMYITGSTDSTNFPKLNATQAAKGGLLDAFVTKMKADGTALLFSTYLGGAENEFGNDIAVDPAGNYYVTGQTVSPNFPIVNPFQPQYGGSFFDAFATKYNAAGTIAYSSYLGGNDIDRGFGVAADSAGNAYYSGQTVSTNFPTVNAFQGVNGGLTDVYLTKVAPNGSSLVYSTYLGGLGSDVNWGGLHVTPNGIVTISGGTDSANFPTVQPIQATKNTIRDVFVSVFNTAGSALTFSTFHGGNALDDSYNLDVDANGNIYVVGETYSSNFPVVNPWQPNKNTFTDGFVLKIVP